MNDWVKVDDRRLKLSNLDKPMYPSGFTKAQVIDYYRRISPFLLPHLRDRPITLKRYPDGSNGPFFFEKRCPSHKPSWVQKASVPSSTGIIDYCLVNDLASLIWIANLASLEIHTTLYRAGEPDKPTVLVFDLDPGQPAGILDSAEVAVHLSDLLRKLGLASFPKSTGGKGLHFYVPLNSPVTFAQTKRFARALAAAFEKRFPGRTVSSMKKELRAGKVFIDWSQNDPHKTTVCAYSLRARERPMVSAPLDWSEVRAAVRRGDAGLLDAEPAEVVRRAERKGDLFEGVLRLRQFLPMKMGDRG